MGSGCPGKSGRIPNAAGFAGVSRDSSLSVPPARFLGRVFERAEQLFSRLSTSWLSPVGCRMKSLSRGGSAKPVKRGNIGQGHAFRLIRRRFGG